MSELPEKPAKSGSLFSIALIYAIFGGLWILLSDRIVVALFNNDPEQLGRVSMIKGWFFIAVTTLMLYALIRRQVEQLQAAHRHELELHTQQQNSLRLLAAIARASQDAIFAKDLHGKYTLFNEAACIDAGKSLDQVLGRDDAAVFPAQAEQLLVGDRLVMTEGRLETFELTIDTARRGRRTYLITKGPLRDSDGKLNGIFGIARDITKRKRVEEELRENEARFRALVEQSAAGIYIIQDNRFQYVHPHLAKLFGYDSPRRMIAAATIADLVAPDQRDFISEKMSRRMAGDSTESHYEVAGMRQDGTRLELELYGNLLMHGDRPAMIGLIIDITDRKRAERELKQRNEELERINQAMVGRELAMIEMKKDINRLSRQLGLEEPYDLGFLDEADGMAGKA